MMRIVLVFQGEISGKLPGFCHCHDRRYRKLAFFLRICRAKSVVNANSPQQVKRDTASTATCAVASTMQAIQAIFGGMRPGLSS
jgi:hypothetical protein